MLERLEKRGGARGEQQAAARRQELAERLGEAAPRDIGIAVEGEQVVLSGRGLVRRFVADSALRWLVAEVRDG